MRRSLSQTLVASALALLFTAFNVGLPIAMYVCPMMSGDLSACSCNCSPEGLSIGFQRDNCCDSSVLAERNTIPFLGVDKFQTPATELIFVFSPALLDSYVPSLVVASTSVLDTGPNLSAPPLYLRSSTLLI